MEKSVDEGLLQSVEEGLIKITTNYIDRSIIIQDNGIGISKNKFLKILLSFGNSPKRGTNARGFRGIGRLEFGLLSELIFTSKSSKENIISTLK